MKQRYGFYLSLLVWALTACADHVDEGFAEENICLNVSVGDLESASRAAKAEPFKGATPTEKNKLKADVWFSITSGIYADTETDANTHLPCHAYMEFDGTLQYAFDKNGNNNLKYPTDDSQVYCVGLYPSGVWSATDNNTTATATIDGSKDLMFAKEISGKQTEPLSSKVLNFEHQLTWLKVCICATSQDAVAAWGKVRRITIASKTQAEVTLKSGGVSFDTDGFIVAFEGTEDLHTTINEVGSVFCSPTTNNYYTVTVMVGNDDNVDDNNKNKTITKTINLINEDGTPYTGDTKGKLFVLALYFNEYDVVEGVCTLTAWNNQNEDLYLK